MKGIGSSGKLFKSKRRGEVVPERKLNLLPSSPSTWGNYDSCSLFLFKFFLDVMRIWSFIYLYLFWLP